MQRIFLVKLFLSDEDKERVEQGNPPKNGKVVITREVEQSGKKQKVSTTVDYNDYLDIIESEVEYGIENPEANTEIMQNLGYK